MGFRLLTAKSSTPFVESHVYWGFGLFGVNVAERLFYFFAAETHR